MTRSPADGWIGWLGSPNRFQATLVLLVGVSSALLAVQAEATPAAVAVVTLGGLVVGIALAAYLTRIVPESEIGRR